MNVDWRNRFGGWNWISSIRNQENTQNCWAFAMTALYEAMVRIEHCVWCRRSEGDQVRGTGKDWRAVGNLGEAAIFVQRYGIADPDCFPFSTNALPLYLSRPHGPDLEALPVAPTPDRTGRTVRIARESFITITDDEAKKRWIYHDGPMAVMVRWPTDFDAVGGGCYMPTPAARPGAPHAVLVVGFNDDERCWIIKNSWGPGWNEEGFARISYDANLLEGQEFVGVRNTNPDPWTKRRLRNGVLLQGGNGARHNNFELFVRRGDALDHWWRDNVAAGFPWSKAGEIRNSDPWSGWRGRDALDCPAVVQSTFNRNYELVYRSTRQEVRNRNEVTINQLRHIHFDQAFGWWIEAGTFGPLDPVGIPGFVQSARGAPGDFEVVVLTLSGRLEHWTKHNSSPWTRRPGTWYLRERFGTAIRFSGPGLVQSRLGTDSNPTDGIEGNQGELHYVCTGVDGQMRHFRCSAGGSWTQIATFGTGLTSAPCMIEAQFGADDEHDVGNFELCVVINGQIEHWWRDNQGPGTWARSAVFGSDCRAVVGMLQGSFGFNLEIIVERLDGEYQHYWRGGAGWQAGPIIAAPQKVAVPDDLRELSEGAAAQKIRDAGLVPRFTGPSGQRGAWVRSHTPGAGQMVDRGSTVTLQLTTDPRP